MTLTEGVPVAEGSQLSLALKQKASETRAWGPGPREAQEGAGNKSKTDMITSQDPKPHQKLPGTVADRAQLGTPKTKSTIVYLFDFKGVNLKAGRRQKKYIAAVECQKADRQWSKL